MLYIYPGFVSKASKNWRMENAGGLEMPLPLLHATCSYKNVNQPVSQWETSWLKKNLFKIVLGVVLLPASAHIQTKQWKAGRGLRNRVRANLSLHFCRQFVYPRFVCWFVTLQGIKTEGVWGCNTCPVDHRSLWGWAWLQAVCRPLLCFSVCATPASYNTSHA